MMPRRPAALWVEEIEGEGKIILDAAVTMLYKRTAKLRNLPYRSL